MVMMIVMVILILIASPKPNLSTNVYQVWTSSTLLALSSTFLANILSETRPGLASFPNNCHEASGLANLTRPDQARPRIPREVFSTNKDQEDKKSFSGKELFFSTILLPFCSSSATLKSFLEVCSFKSQCGFPNAYFV